MSDESWLRDLLILDAIENSRSNDNGSSGIGWGAIPAVAIFAQLALVAAYPMTLIIQYRRKDWVPFIVTLAILPIGLLWAWPRLLYPDSILYSLFGIESSIGLFALYGYLVFFFCQRLNKKIAKSSNVEFDKRGYYAILSFGISAAFFLWAALSQFNFLMAPVYWWLSCFFKMSFDSAFYDYQIYRKMIWPFVIGGTALAIVPLQAWFRSRKAAGLVSVPTGIVVLTIPASLFSIFALFVLFKTLTN